MTQGPIDTSSDTSLALRSTASIARGDAGGKENCVGCRSTSTRLGGAAVSSSCAAPMVAGTWCAVEL